MPMQQHLQQILTTEYSSLEKAVEFVNTPFPWPICSIEKQSETGDITTVRIRYQDLQTLFALATFYGKELEIQWNQNLNNKP